MKKILFFIMTLILSANISAQDYSNEEIEMMQEVFGDEKRTIIEENVNLEGADAEKFWKLYDQYEAQRKDMGMEKMKLLKSYTTKQGNMTPLQAQEMLAQAADLRSSEDKLIMNFTKRIEKVSNPFVAVQFYQIEHYISDGLRFSILNSVDFIQD
ncbi:MAG: hypothetical protein WBV45_01325 [Lutimonas sp.]